MKNILKIVLLFTALVMAYFVYAEIMKPIQFKKFKEERYAYGVDRLMKIREAQQAYKTANNRYASTFDSLVAFVDTGKIAVVARKDTALLVTGASGVTEYKDVTLYDTVAIVSVKDSLFKNQDYKKLGVIEVNENEFPIDMDAKMEEIPDSLLDKFEPQPFFKAAIAKRHLLDGATENDILVSINEEGDIDGDDIHVGNLRKASTDGNWTKDYERLAKEYRENNK